MNDETALALRTLKDSAGNYLWKESDETIFSKSVQIVDSMPSIGKGKKVIAFGDFSNYWLVQRFPLTIRTLNILKCRTLSKGGDDVCGVNM